tara:strand:+ start:1303 stop:1554 length:252 start_codon:yes stop_codon:yes gene_type:complete
MKKRRFLGHVSSVLQLKAEAQKALDAALEEGHIHGSQQHSGSVYATEPNARLYFRGTDEQGNERTYFIDVTRGLTRILPTGSV